MLVASRTGRSKCLLFELLVHGVLIREPEPRLGVMTLFDGHAVSPCHNEDVLEVSSSEGCTTL